MGYGGATVASDASDTVLANLAYACIGIRNVACGVDPSLTLFTPNLVFWPGCFHLRGFWFWISGASRIRDLFGVNPNVAI